MEAMVQKIIVINNSDLMVPFELVLKSTPYFKIDTQLENV